jgi:ribosomal-protein-alanine acetyltransferase
MKRPARAAIRPAVQEDVDALLAIENAAFLGDRLERRSFLHAVRAPTIDLIVAARGGAVVGYAAVHRRRGASVAHLASIAVRPELAGQGLGRRLLQAAEAEAVKRGCARLRLEARPDNAAAQRLYARAGYRRIGTVADYYEDGEPAWRYEKELPPLPLAGRG